MAKDSVYRRGSVVGAILLVGLGLLFLYANLRGMDAWPLVSQWWPLLLILLGLGKLWDFLASRSQPEGARRSWLSGGEIAVIVLLLLFGIGLSRTGRLGLGSRSLQHSTQSVDREGAQSVRAHLEIGAGELRIAGGANNLMDADFDYSEAEGTPKVEYHVTGDQGQLTVTQSGGNVHFGRTRNNWNLRFANGVPMELKVNMGAGQGDLRLGGLSLTRLDIEMGAGEVTVDLTGDWKKDLDANIQGGVGTANIRLPRNVGVQVHAAGGIGSINAGGLTREGGAYVNDAYGKSAVTLRLNVHGGIGTINLE